MAKSMIDLPSASAAVSHLGLNPRPVQVEPDSGSRYLGATLAPVFVPPAVDGRALRSATVSLCSVMSERMREIASERASDCASLISFSSAAFCASNSESGVVISRLKSSMPGSMVATN